MGILIDIGKVNDAVYVCNGCCCGHEEKGNPSVLNEFIEAQIKENDIDASIHKPYCLGPCSQANVIKARVDGKNYWFRKMNNKEDIIDLVRFVKHKELTENLRSKQMEM